MAAYKLYVRGAAADVLIDDLGFTVPQGPSWTQLNSSSPLEGLGDVGQFTARDLRDSADLANLIQASTLEWSLDGTNAELGSDYKADFMLMQDFTDDALDLTSGVLTVPNGVSAPGAGQEGNIFWDADNDALYMHDGDEWLLVATASGVINDHGALQGLDDDDHPQYHDGSLPYTGDLDMGGNDITNVGLVDGVDVSVLDSTVSGHIADGTIHFTEASIDHTAIQNIGTNSHADIDNHIADSTIHFTEASIDHGSIAGLGDDDHPQYPQWATDETISGVWTFDPADTDPNFIMEPVAAAPTNNLVDGAMAVINGILSAYDATRTKWLSVDRKFLIAGKDGFAKDLYLRFSNIASSQTGFRALRNGTITGIFMQADVASTWTLEVRRNGVVTVLASLASGGAQGAQDATINADFSAGDEIQLYANTGGVNITAPIGGIEIAWRF